MLVTNNNFSYTFIEIIQIYDIYSYTRYIHYTYNVKWKSLIKCFYFIQDHLLVYYDYHVYLHKTFIFN